MQKIGPKQKGVNDVQLKQIRKVEFQIFLSATPLTKVMLLWKHVHSFG